MTITHVCGHRRRIALRSVGAVKKSVEAFQLAMRNCPDCEADEAEQVEHNPEAELAEMRSEYRHEDDERYQLSDAEIQSLAQREVEDRTSDACMDGDHEQCHQLWDSPTEENGTVYCACTCHNSRGE